MRDDAERTAFVRGFRAMMPLWLGVVPFGVAYALRARQAGLSPVETRTLSLLVFAGSAQVSAVGLFGRGAGAAEIVLTTFLISLRGARPCLLPALTGVILKRS